MIGAQTGFDRSLIATPKHRRRGSLETRRGVALIPALHFGVSGAGSGAGEISTDKLSISTMDLLRTTRRAMRPPEKSVIPEAASAVADTVAPRNPRTRVTRNFRIAVPQAEGCEPFSRPFIPLYSLTSSFFSRTFEVTRAH